MPLNHNCLIEVWNSNVIIECDFDGCCIDCPKSKAYDKWKQNIR